MPRTARIVAEGYPHHVTQRGNNKQDVFFVDDDRTRYLDFLGQESEKNGLVIIGYCLMTNHIHLIVKPSATESLADAIGRTHFRYTQYINMRHARSGHLWQNRDDILYEFDGDNTLQARHTHGPGTDDPLYTQAGNSYGAPGDFYYYHKDGMNSVREITDEDGEVVQRIDYDSFGNILSINGCAYDPAANTITTGTGGGGSSTETYAPPHDFFHTYAYTGRQWDPETGLYYYRARYYDASIGRFISEDPQWNVNPYTYVKNNPIKYGDPSGKWIKEFLNSLFPKGPFGGFGNQLALALEWMGVTYALQTAFKAIDMMGIGMAIEDVEYVIKNSLTSFVFFRFETRQGRAMHGTLFVIEEGQIIDSYKAKSGSSGSYRHLPRGTYDLSRPVIIADVSDNKAYCMSGSCWWATMNNSGYGIHPMGGDPGTKGCIGIKTYGESVDALGTITSVVDNTGDSSIKAFVN